MPISVEQADALLKAGRISQSTYDSIAGVPPTGPMMSFGDLGPADYAPPQEPAPPPPPGPMPDYGPAPPPGDPSALDTRLPGATPEPPPAPPQGRVDVGPITAIPSGPPKGATPAPKPAAQGGPSLASTLRGVTDAENSKLRAEQRGIGKEADIAAQRAVEEADLRDQQRAEADQQRVLDMAAREQETKQRDDLIAQRMSAVDAFRNAKVDPEQWKKEQGPLGNLAAALAIGAGAFGAALSGGPNYALQIINGNIDRNIRAQEAELAKKKDEVTAADSSLAHYRQITGDNEAARAAARADMLTRQRDALAGMASKYGAAVDQAKLATSVQAIDADIAKNDAIVKERIAMAAGQQAAASASQQRAQAGKIADMAKEFVLKGDDPIEAQRKAVAFVTGKAPGTEPLKALPLDPEKAARAGEIAEKKDARMVRVGGRELEAQTPDEAKKLRDGAAEYETAMSGIKRLMALRAKHGGGTFDPNDSAEMKSIAADVMLRLKNSFQLGVLSQSDLDMLGKMVPSDPSEFSPLGTTDKRLETAASNLDRSFNAQVSAHTKGGNPASNIGFRPEKK